MAANRSSTSKDRRNVRWAKLASCAVIAAAVAAVASSAVAQPAPTYQRKGTFAGHDFDRHREFRHSRMPQFSSRTSAGSFQRPYPYHLDYYRAKWGGSYAPYFGNLYGPPNYFINGVPFFNNGFGPWGGFNSFGFPSIGFDNQFGGFGGAGFGGPGFGGAGFGGPGWNGGWGGTPYGPWSGEFMGAEGMPADAEFAP